MSGAGYTIYANGYNDFVNNCELSDLEQATVSSDSNNPTIIPYDGFLIVKNVIMSDGYYSFYINGIHFDNGGITGGYFTVTFPIKKGDRIYTDIHNSGTPYFAYYKKRDYSNR